MKVSLIAATKLYGVHPDQKLGYRDERGNLTMDDPPLHADVLIEYAGRLCYQSWEKKNPATREVFNYIGNIISQGHWSVLEHVSATLLVQDVSHPFLWEISRHRHLSFSVMSSRYVDPPDTCVIPPALEGDDDAEGLLTNFYEEAKELYDQLVERLHAKGLPRKKVREAARAVLPYMTSVDMVISANLRGWIEVIQKRFIDAADAELQAFAKAAIPELMNVSSAAMIHVFGTGPKQENNS